MRAHLDLARWFPLAAALLASGCLFAPQPVDGEPSGSACGTDIDCADGLMCECGTCVTATDNPLPASCDVTPDDRCPDLASECFQACGVDTVVGLAECINGRETCEASSGVLREEDCSPDVCWGEPEAGETCLNGDFVCQFGRNEETGLCYTFDCDGDPAECVTSCQDDETVAQICVANTWTCEFGFPIEQCGGCVGTPPDCFDSCEGLNTIAAATCQDNAWSCNHIQDAQLPSACCEGSLNLLTDDDFVANQDVRCSTGTVLVRYQTRDTLELPELKRARELLFYENESTAVSLPALERVDQAFSLWMNSDLVEASFPELSYVGGSFEIAFNPSFPQCRVTELVAGVQTIVGQRYLTDNDPDGSCDADGGVLTDGGPLTDGGLGDAGTGDAGVPLDAGPLDAGAVDAGDPVDAGTQVDSGADAG